jgi:putative tricarboxylic transport membrane protein
MRAPRGQLAVGAGVALIGLLVLWGAFYLPTEGGYAQIGPGVVPRIVGGVTLLLGVLLVREAWATGFRGVDEEAEARLPMDWPAFAWVTAGIIGYGVLIEYAGFILASTLLFVLVARGFGSRRWLLNAVTGAVLAVAVFAIFNYGLGLTLPVGVLKGLGL